MKKFKKTMPYLMAAIMVALSVTPSLDAYAMTKNFEMGAQDPTEVVGTYDSTTNSVTLTNNYTYDPTGTAEELPNPGYMSEQRQATLLDYLSANKLKVALNVSAGVKSIASSAFSNNNNIVSLSVLGSDLAELGDGAFEEARELKSADLSSTSLTKVPDNLFQHCSALTSVQLPSTVTEIGVNAFGATGITSFNIPSNVTTIRGGAFGYTNLTTIHIPASVTTINTGAFANTKITSITGGEGLVTVEDGAFSGMTAMSYPSGIDALSNYDWEGNGYTDLTIGGVAQLHVKLNSGLEGVTYDDIIVSSGKELTEAPVVTNADYTFLGWYKDAALKTVAEFPMVITEETTLYAKWQANYVTVMFVPGEDIISFTQKVAMGGLVTEPEIPETIEKVFVGWYKESTFENEFNFAKDAVSADTTLYGKWVDPTYYTVKFDTDNAKEEIEDQSIKAGGYVIDPGELTKEDYTFAGWYSDSSFENEWDFNKSEVKGDMTLYAKFESNFVTVKFNTNGGGAIAAITVERGKTITSPTAPTKANCTFLGWYTDSGCTKDFSFESKVYEDTTLYAGWDQTAFTVTFEANGGSSVAAIVTNPNTLIAKPADPTKEGYYLEAWCIDSDLETAWNFDSNKVTKDMTLYAKWKTGAAPTVNNTNAAIPQTGDMSTPIANALGGGTATLSAIGAAIVNGVKKRKGIL